MRCSTWMDLQKHHYQETQRLSGDILEKLDVMFNMEGCMKFTIKMYETHLHRLIFTAIPDDKLKNNQDKDISGNYYYHCNSRNFC